MTMATGLDRNEERRKRVFVGTLPNDFLRISPSDGALEQIQQDATLSLEHEMVGMPYASNAIGRLTLTIVRAKLVKNYGYMKMDPYVRLRVGHSIFETNSDSYAGRTPKWNRDIQCLLPQGVTSIYIEIFDECSFTADELIAWAQIPIPTTVMKGQTYEDWFELSGKQGDGKEGMINIVMSFVPVNLSKIPPGSYYPAVGLTPVLAFPYGIKTFKQVPLSYAPPVVQPVIPPPPQPSEEDIKLMEDMFPNMDKEVIRSVYEANMFNKDVAVNSLLRMVD